MRSRLDSGRGGQWHACCTTLVIPEPSQQRNGPYQPTHPLEQIRMSSTRTPFRLGLLGVPFVLVACGGATDEMGSNLSLEQTRLIADAPGDG